MYAGRPRARHRQDRRPYTPKSNPRNLIPGTNRTEVAGSCSAFRGVGGRVDQRLSQRHTRARALVLSLRGLQPSHAASDPRLRVDADGCLLCAAGDSVWAAALETWLLISASSPPQAAFVYRDVPKEAPHPC
eukprot:243159-Rhodomonas_salina.3